MIEIGTLDRLRLGDHACVVFDDDATRLTALRRWFDAGLRDDHRILYHGPAAYLGPRAAAAAGRGQLRMATPESSYLAGGRFDPEATIAGWRHESATARADGYRGLRAAGDMSWGARPMPGGDRLAWYEANVSRVFADGAAMAVCLYDRRLFTDADLRRVCWAHPATVEAEPAPLLRATRTGTPPGIRLEGEAGTANRHALRTLLESLTEDTPAGAGEQLVVDIGGLTFLDAAAARILLRAAAADAARLRVVGCSPAMQRLLHFNGANATVERAPVQ